MTDPPEELSREQIELALELERRLTSSDILAEQCVLGGMMLSQDAISDVVEVLRSQDFYRPAHQVIYDAILDIYGRGEPADAVMVAGELTKRGEATRTGGAPYLFTLINSVPTAANAGYYAGIVGEHSDDRKTAGLLMRGWQAGADIAAIGAELITLTEKRRSTAVQLMLAELLDARDLASIPTLEPLIADTLMLDTLARLIGPSGSFKSFVALDFAGCVGTGKDWHGAAVRQGLVIYIVAEGVKGVGKRVRAWEQYYGHEMTGVKFLPRPVQVRGTEWALLIELCRRLRPSLIVIDTQARVTVGVEENSATEMGIVNEQIERLRNACEACVLVVHHSGLESGRGRGSTAVKGVMQTELGVSREGEGADIRVTLDNSKQKDDAELDDRVFRLERIELKGEFKANGDPVTSVVLVPVDADTGTRAAAKRSPAAEKVLAALRALGMPSTQQAIGDAIAAEHGNGLRRETMSRILNALLQEGVVDREDLGPSWIVWSLKQSPALPEMPSDDPVTPPVTGNEITGQSHHTVTARVSPAQEPISGVTNALITPGHKGVSDVTAPFKGGHTVTPPLESRSSQPPQVAGDDSDRAQSEDLCPACVWPLGSAGHQQNCSPL